jgi:hypothetical protein
VHYLQAESQDEVAAWITDMTKLSEILWKEENVLAKVLTTNSGDVYLL